MASVGEITVPIKRITEDLTVNVKVSGLNIWKVKLWVAKQLFKFASLITGLDIEVDIKHEEA